jgi:hypothetical protein
MMKSCATGATITRVQNVIIFAQCKWDFLIEVGRDFCLVGSEYPLQVSRSLRALAPCRCLVHDLPCGACGVVFGETSLVDALSSL